MKGIIALIIMIISPLAMAADIVEEAKKMIELQTTEYKEKGITGYVAAMAKANPMTGQQTLENQMLGSMITLEGMCGKPVGYSIKAISKLSEESANALFVINLEKCPLFVRQLFYRSKSGQITSPSFLFNMQPEQVWPNEIIFQAK